MGDSTIEFPMHFPEFPQYLEVFIRHTPSDAVSDEGGSIRVVVRSKIHKTKEVILPTSVTKGYYDKCPNRFRSEIKYSIIERYGLERQPERWTICYA